MGIRWWVCLYWWLCIIKSTLKGNGNSKYQLCYKIGRLNTRISKSLQNNLFLALVIKKLPLIQNLQKSVVWLLIQETGYKYKNIINVNLMLAFMCTKYLELRKEEHQLWDIGGSQRHSQKTLYETRQAMYV